MSKTYNLGLAFYRHYYKGWNWAKNCPKGKEYINEKKEKEKAEQAFFDKKSEPILNQKLGDVEYKYIEIPGLDRNLVLHTTYPGLLLGIGYAHGIGVLGEHKIGFYFDHTTGLPVVPGSSIKGLLRSAFPLSIKDVKKDTAKTNRMAYIKGILEDIGEDKTKLTDAFIQQLELEIFEGKFQLNGEQKNMPNIGRDIFFDALLDGPDGANFMGNDFITPHKNTDGDGIPDVLKNPIPLQFLKVLPEIAIRFQFKLPTDFDYQNDKKDWVKHERLLTPDQRKKLFRQILLDLGIGAKTNVGYGQLRDKKEAFNIPPLPQRKQPTKQDVAKVVMAAAATKVVKKYGAAEVGSVAADYPTKALNLKRPIILEAVVIKSGFAGVEVEVYFDVDKDKPVLPLTGTREKPEIGTVITVNATYSKKKKTIVQVSFNGFKKEKQ